MPPLFSDRPPSTRQSRRINAKPLKYQCVDHLIQKVQIMSLRLLLLLQTQDLRIQEGEHLTLRDLLIGDRS